MCALQQYNLLILITSIQIYKYNVIIKEVVEPLGKLPTSHPFVVIVAVVLNILQHSKVCNRGSSTA